MQRVHQSKKTIHWLNYVRAISMISIYYIHAQEFFGYSIHGLGKYIFPFYVNSFFFVSGYLLFRKYMSRPDDYKKLTRFCLENILFRLVIPSILFSAVFYIPSSIIQNRSLSLFSFLEKTIAGGTFWYISALAVAELVFCLLYRCGIRNMFVFCLIGIALFVPGMIIAKNEIVIFEGFTDNPWYFEKGFMAFIFLVFGGLYWKYETLVDKYINKLSVACLLAVFYIIVMHFFSSNISVLISTKGMNGYGVVMSTISILILVVLCKLISGNNMITKLLDSIGKKTMGLYLVCGSIPKVIAIFHPKGNLIYVIMGFVISFSLSYLCVIILDRFFPFLFDVRRVWYHQKETRSHI